MAKTAQQMTDKFKAGLANAGKAYTDGVMAVSVAPSTKAIAAKDKWAQKLQEAIANGSFEAGLQGVTLQSWQQASSAAAPKLTTAAPQAAVKFGKYAAVAAPILKQISETVRAMPSTTDADMEARALENMRLVKSQLKGITRGRR